MLGSTSECRIMKRRLLLSFGLWIALSAVPAAAEATQAEFDAQLKGIMTKLNAEADGPEGVAVLASLIQNEFSTSIEELRQSLDSGMSWGSIAVFAYICATTGQTFEALGSAEVDKDIWNYADKAGMSVDKMSRSLSRLVKQVESERNTRIFERLRSDRRVSRIPDLGSGFGILQETLDFRRLEAPRPTKVHTVGTGR
jgi:hypothetical protein